MNEILITGHKNPDTDSVCAAWCYARLKNTLDGADKYRGVVCGSLNSQTKYVFEKVGIAPPDFVKDVFPRVIDVARNDGTSLDINDPVFEAIRDIDEYTISVIPVFENRTEFKGIIGIHEMASYVVRTGTLDKKMRYIFNVSNMEKVIPGKFLKKGDWSEFAAPIMIGAMDYKSTVERIESMLSEKPVLVCGNRRKIVEYAVRQNLPAIIFTNATDESLLSVDFSEYKGSVYLSKVDTAETVRLLWLSAPVKLIMNTDPIVLQYDQIFDDAKKILLSSDLRGLPVMKKKDFAGIVTRRSFIEKPRKKLILVDHNESGQSINGASEADVIEIIDHHRLAAEKTASPIYVFAKPVGSTCTLVFQHYLMHNVSVDRVTAQLLLSGILSDTLFLKSPTSTAEDVRAAEDCAWIAGIDIDKYSADLLSRMTILKNADAASVVNGDCKIYREKGFAVAISQVETISLEDIWETKSSLLDSLEKIKLEKSLNWAMLLVTDVVHSHSHLLLTDFYEGEKNLIYKQMENNLYDLPGILSRKKQLLPEILRVLDCVEESSRI